jgi:branched-chain amino acid transport system permease protein
LAVKNNEERTKFLGFNHSRIKLQIFVISAFYASLAGICFVMLKAFVAPDYVHWSFSGNVLMMTLLGGMGSLLGPLFGAIAFISFQDWASSITENWMAFVGGAFILVVLFLPKGVFGWLFKR